MTNRMPDPTIETYSVERAEKAWAQARILLSTLNSVGGHHYPDNAYHAVYAIEKDLREDVNVDVGTVEGLNRAIKLLEAVGASSFEIDSALNY